MSNSFRQILQPARSIFIAQFFFIILISISPTSSQENTYDFIIVGGGTAGLVVARRLVEAQNNLTVLVLESGDEPKEDSDIPAFAPRAFADPQLSFRYSSTPQKNAALKNNGIVTVLSGRVLSGSSNINLMFWNRGNKKDYDNWSNLVQDASWNYSNMLKYFKRAETYQGDYPSDQHGSSGPLTISRPKYAPGLDFWLEAGKSLGYEIADPSGPQKNSFGPIEFTKKQGRRVNSLDGYITPIRSTSPNLQIATNTDATQIIFDNNRAIGVSFQSSSQILQNIQPQIVYARKEIIVSAGAVGSPLILLRSGIGPKGSLLEANIPIVQDLPVGLNYQDHAVLILPFVVNSNALIMDDDRDLNPSTFEQYQTTGEGPFSCSRGTLGQAFIASSVAQLEGEGDWSDVQLVMAHNKQSYFGTRLVETDSVTSEEGPLSTWVILNRPKSRGSLRLNPTNPGGPPLLDVGYFSDPRDVQKMLDGLDEMFRIFERTPAYQSVGARFPPSLNLPECNHLEYRSRAFWECFIRYTGSGGTHPAGTCRMGMRNDSNAVVDQRLRVIDVDGLRVCDASIMPFIINANPQAAVYGIAEKASDMILEDWGFAV